jgi:hypothetical protein
MVYSKRNFTAGENITSKGDVVQHANGYEYETSKYGFLETELPATFNDMRTIIQAINNRQIDN